MSANTPRIRAATVWLDGCSGCHMSFLDLDERLIELAERIDFVYTPLVDTKEFPDNVDLTLVEGAVSSADDLAKIQRIRQRTRLLISLGDCAVTGNVPSMRNAFSVQDIFQRAYFETATLNPSVQIGSSRRSCRRCGRSITTSRSTSTCRAARPRPT